VQRGFQFFARREVVALQHFLDAPIERKHPPTAVFSVTDTGRRRRWTDAQKVRIVEASFGQRGSMSEIARRHDFGRKLLVRKRRLRPNDVLLAVARSVALATGVC